MCANPTLRSQAPASLLHLGFPRRAGPKIKKNADKSPDRLNQSSMYPCASRGRNSLQHDPICTIPESPCRPTRTGSPLAPQALAFRCRPTVVRQNRRRADTHCTNGNGPVSTQAGEAPVSTLDVYQIRDCLASNACATQRTARVPASHLAGD